MPLCIHLCLCVCVDNLITYLCIIHIFGVHVCVCVCVCVCGARACEGMYMNIKNEFILFYIHISDIQTKKETERQKNDRELKRDRCSERRLHKSMRRDWDGERKERIPDIPLTPGTLQME